MNDYPSTGERPPTEGQLTDALAQGFSEVLRLARFSDVEEWLEELVKQRETLVIPWIRFTGLFTWDPAMQVVQHVTAVGGFWGAAEFVELRYYCGSRMQGDKGAAVERYELARKMVEVFCRGWGIQVRGGYYPQAEKGGGRAR